MVDTVRGQIRVRTWPRKRGPGGSPAQLLQRAWFKGANQLAKVVEPTQQNLAIAMTKGTGLYPRDLLLRQMSGGMYRVITADGREIKPAKRFRETAVFQGAILELSAAQSLPAGANTPIIWPLPVRDTNGFWSAATPTLLTIPDGVGVIAIEAGWRATLSLPNNNTSPNILHNGVLTAVSAARISGNSAGVVTKGAVIVVPGDTLEFRIFTSAANFAEGGPQTHFTLNVLEAD